MRNSDAVVPEGSIGAIANPYTLRPEQLAGWVRELRRAVGLGQPEFAARIGLKVLAISTWENGRAKPTRPKIDAMVKAFGIPVAAPDRAAIGKQINDARCACGLTVAELATRCGLSRGTLSTWIEGHREPTPEQLEAVLAACSAEARRAARRTGRAR